MYMSIFYVCSYRKKTESSFLKIVLSFLSSGYYAFRNPNTGSRFIKCLSDVFTDRDHFYRISEGEERPLSFAQQLTRVMALVTKETSDAPSKLEYHNKKQTPVIYSMLTKELCLRLRDTSNMWFWECMWHILFIKIPITIINVSLSLCIYKIGPAIHGPPVAYVEENPQFGHTWATSGLSRGKSVCLCMGHQWSI